jgi:hypothetical protein
LEGFHLKFEASKFPRFTVEPPLLIQRVEDLDLLEDPFTHKEIDDANKGSPQ